MVSRKADLMRKKEFFENCEKFLIGQHKNAINYHGLNYLEKADSPTLQVSAIEFSGSRKRITVNFCAHVEGCGPRFGVRETAKKPSESNSTFIIRIDNVLAKYQKWLDEFHTNLENRFTTGSIVFQKRRHRDSSR